MIRAAGAVARHPSLWPTALRQLRRLTPPGWWRRRPFLPVPSGDYLAFRLHWGLIRILAVASLGGAVFRLAMA